MESLARSSRLVARLSAEASAPEVSEQREHDEYDHDDPDQVHHTLSLTIGNGERSIRATPDSLGAAQLSSWDAARTRQLLFPVSEVLARIVIFDCRSIASRKVLTRSGQICSETITVNMARSPGRLHAGLVGKHREVRAGL